MAICSLLPECRVPCNPIDSFNFSQSNLVLILSWISPFMIIVEWIAMAIPHLPKSCLELFQAERYVCMVERSRPYQHSGQSGQALSRLKRRSLRYFRVGWGYLLCFHWRRWRAEIRRENFDKKRAKLKGLRCHFIKFNRQLTADGTYSVLVFIFYFLRKSGSNRVFNQNSWSLKLA